MAERIATEQFKQKTIVTNANLKEHVTDFQRLWVGMEKQWKPELTDAEQAQFAALTTGNERDAFRIIRNFNRWAKYEARTDFPLGIENLGGRLGISPKGASKLRTRFKEVRIIQQTQPYQANKTAARFVWLSR